MSNHFLQWPWELNELQLEVSCKPKLETRWNKQDLHFPVVSNRWSCFLNYLAFKICRCLLKLQWHDLSGQLYFVFVNYIDKCTGTPTHFTYRSCTAMESLAKLHHFWAGVKARGDLKLCSYWVSKALVTFMHLSTRNPAL